MISDSANVLSRFVNFFIRMGLLLSEIECLLLTWHGTFVFGSLDGSRLYHRAISDVTDLGDACRFFVQTGIDLAVMRFLPFQDGSLQFSSSLFGGGFATRASDGNGYNFLKGGLYLSASGRGNDVGCTREIAQTWERFLLLPVDFVNQLLAIQFRDWKNLATGEAVLRKSILFKSEFLFRVGPFEINLSKTYPTFFVGYGGPRTEPNEPDGFLIVHNGSVRAFSSKEKAPIRRDDQIWLRYAEGELDSEDGRSRIMESSEILFYPPVFADRDERTFFIDKARNGRPKLGFHAGGVKLASRANSYVFLSRGIEGVVFDAGGVRRGFGYLTSCTNLPNCLSRAEDRIFLNRIALEAAPNFEGNYGIFYNGNLQNHYHWLVEGLLSLFTLKKSFPNGLKVVLPNTLYSVSNLQYLESLNLLGFGDIEVNFSDAPIVRVAEASWGCTRESHDDITVQMLLEFQSLAASSVRAAAGHRRIYIERDRVRAVENGDEIRGFLESNGFVTLRLENMSFLDQVTAFVHADFIVGPHGAGLSNLVFAPPSARVIEFMPDAEMRPFFWMISNKLGHEYGMIKCKTDDGTFNGKLRVDVGKLRRLFSLLEMA